MRSYGDITAADFEHCLDPEFRKMRDRVSMDQVEDMLSRLSRGTDHYSEAQRRAILERFARVLKVHDDK